ncbi:hypothetical protein LV457_02875 [Mycobacterium sp. MYCO198283]|uniref:hypothetical protein n=1 Tax=Mycobacterium sp. MYCO198283 TaxID=2883505 RepID=UPI001E2FB47F|nr:hypothetical protein [Mycobacterium sp. MYCO198283]MCG5431233.1 hypothetical protein [Mycobacterium sp. MYCO198283]
MSAPKAGTYVLAGAAFYRTEGDGDDAVRRRYKRGDRVQLSKAEAARLAVPTRLAPAAFVPASDDVQVVPGDDLISSPHPAVNRVSEANQLVAEANTGLNTVTEGGAVLSADQVASEVSAPLVTGAGAGNVVPVGDVSGAAPSPVTDSGAPAKSATLDAWKAHAVKVGAVTEAEAGDMTKPQLQEAVARKAR